MAHFKDAKFKMTPQRAAIIRILEGNTSHPSAEEIYEAIKSEYPMTSLATVYNTLAALTKRGLLQELFIDGERKRYDPDTSPHHHLICTRCRKVVDLHAEFNLELPEGLLPGFAVKARHVAFSGLCADCSKDQF